MAPGRRPEAARKIRRWDGGKEGGQRVVDDTARGRSRLDPDTRREQILAAAEAVFAGRDPNEVTFEQVAEAAGVSRALVYNYFPDRGALIADVYLRTYARLGTRLAEAADGQPPGASRLRAVIHSYFAFAEEHVEAAALIRAAEISRHPVVEAARRRRAEVVERAARQTPEGRLIARGVTAMLEAAVLHWWETRELEPEWVEEVLFTVLWRGFGALSDIGLELPGPDD